MKRLLTIALIVATAVMTVAPMATPVRAAMAGDLIKMAGNPAVYYLGANSKRYVFPNQNTYMTWYADFSTVKTISQSELESYSLGGNVTYRAGTRLVKVTTNPKVYAVEPGGVLRWVNSESIMSSLYGAEWWKMIDDVPDPFWVNYTEGSDITSATYPTGSLVKESGSSVIYYIDGSEKRPVADMTAFNANRFQNKNVLTASSLSSYADGTSITGAEAAISSIDGSSSTTNGGSASTGTLTVALAGDTPASTTIVKSAILVPFTKVNFTATGGDVIVDSVQIKRMGLSQDSNLTNVYLLDPATMSIFGNEKTLSSTHTAYVTKDFTVTSGTTKSFYLAATMASSLQAAEMVSLAVSEVNVKGNATVVGSLPVNGNEMTMNNTITIGTVTQDNGSSNPSAASKQVGITDYVFAATKLTVNSTEDVQVEGLKFHQAGTAADSDIGNFDLVVEGSVLATVAKASDGDVYFDLSSSPYTIGKGLNKTFEIRGDILDGSGRTIWFNHDKQTDIKAKGKTYGYYIDPVYSTSDISSPYWDNSSSGDNAVTTISTGTLVISKKQLDNTYVAEGVTQATIGAFNFRANGEPVIITALDVKITTTTLTNTGLVDNVTLYDENGSVVAGPVTPSEIDDDGDTAVARFSDTFTVPTGEHVYYVKADLDSNFAAGDTIICSIETPAASATSADEITAKGEVTNNAVYPTPYANVTADTMTVRVGTLTFSTLNTPVAQTVVAGAQDHVFAYFVLDAAAAGEDIKVTQLSIHHTSTTGGELGNISGITLYNGSTVLNNNDIEDGDSSAAGSYATSTIDLDSPLIIPKGGSVTLTLKADISASADEGHKFGLFGGDVLVAYGNSTGNSITETGTASQGQTQTATTNASLTISVGSGSATSDALIPGNSDGVTVGVFNFRAQYSNVNLEELYLTIDEIAGGSGNGGPDQFDKIYLYDGSTKVAEATPTTTDTNVEGSGGDTIHFDMTASPVTITAGTSKNLTVKVDTADPNYYSYGTNSKAESGEGFFLKINATGDVVARANGLLGDSEKTLNGGTLKNYTLFRSIPTILTNEDVASPASGALPGGTTSNMSVYKFSVTADPAGDVALYKVSFWVATTTATATNWALYEGGTQVAASSTPINVDISDNTTRTQIVELLFTSDGTAPDAGEGDVLPQTITAGTTKTYTLKATLEGPTATGTNGSVSIQFLGDTTVNTTNPNTAKALRAGTGKYDNNVIWGDLWRTYDTASGTASATEQWSNGYLIPSSGTNKLQNTSTAVTFSRSN